MNEHRFKRTGVGRRARPPYAVNDYIQDCVTRVIYDGMRYETMNDYPTEGSGTIPTVKVSWGKLGHEDGQKLTRKCYDVYIYSRVTPYGYGYVRRYSTKYEG